jgi:hypothetical protein
MPDPPPLAGVPTDLDFEKSLMFFHAYMYGPLQGKLRLYGARGIPAGSVAMSSDWEVFASMLVKDLGRKFGAGINVGHLFFSYSDTLDRVELRYLHGSQLTVYFNKWLDDYPDPYPQRYRKSIPYGYVLKQGQLLMTIVDGEVVHPNLAKVPAEEILPAT